MNTISAQEARKIQKQATTRKINDASKIKTIMKNIKVRAAQGFDYYDYQPCITYNMAKTLIALGFDIIDTNRKCGRLDRYNLLTSKNKMELEDFAESKQYGKRISWGAD